MAKVKSHIGQIRERFTCSQRHILTALNWDEDSYNNAWIDMGLAYLEAQYPAQDTRYAEYNQKVRRDRRFWQWWLLEWKNRESRFLTKIQGKKITPDDYRAVMSSLMQRYAVDKSFEQNYLNL